MAEMTIAAAPHRRRSPMGACAVEQLQAARRTLSAAVAVFAPAIFLGRAPTARELLTLLVLAAGFAVTELALLRASGADERREGVRLSLRLLLAFSAFAIVLPSSPLLLALFLAIGVTRERAAFLPASAGFALEAAALLLRIDAGALALGTALDPALMAGAVALFAFLHFAAQPVLLLLRPGRPRELQTLRELALATSVFVIFAAYLVLLSRGGAGLGSVAAAGVGLLALLLWRIRGLAQERGGEAVLADPLLPPLAGAWALATMLAVSPLAAASAPAG